MAIKQYKLIILDRDGVINVDSKEYIKSPAEWLPLPGSLEAIAKLNQVGLLVAVASNQSGLARGFFTEPTLQKIHKKMIAALAKVGGHFDAIIYCPHHPDDNCKCRKPKPKMLQDLMQQFHVTPAKTLFIGDKDTDRQAAQAAECDVVLVTAEKNLATIVNDLLT